MSGQPAPRRWQAWEMRFSWWRPFKYGAAKTPQAGKSSARPARPNQQARISGTQAFGKAALFDEDRASAGTHVCEVEWHDQLVGHRTHRTEHIAFVRAHAVLAPPS